MHEGRLFNEKFNIFHKLSCGLHMSAGYLREFRVFYVFIV